MKDVIGRKKIDGQKKNKKEAECVDMASTLKKKLRPARLDLFIFFYKGRMTGYPPLFFEEKKR